MKTGEVERLFRCKPNRYEYFVAFAGREDRFVLRSESAEDVPNYYLATLGGAIDATEGEATRSYAKKPITRFEDPTPRLRQIEKRLVRYERDDGVPLSSSCSFPPATKRVRAYRPCSTPYSPGVLRPVHRRAGPGFRPSVSAASMAPRTSFSCSRDMQCSTTPPCPWSGIPKLPTTRSCRSSWLTPRRRWPRQSRSVWWIRIASESSATATARSWWANLLAHTDLFRAGIARSGSHNKTMQPFGFQSERRSVFEAVMPIFSSRQPSRRPGQRARARDSRQGGLQSRHPDHPVRGLFRSCARLRGIARLVLLPFEDHGYRAVESIEHVLWEQITWFDKFVKNAAPRTPLTADEQGECDRVGDR